MHILWDIQFLKFKINSCTKSATLEANGFPYLVGEQGEMGDKMLSGMAVAGRCGLLG